MWLLSTVAVLCLAQVSSEWRCPVLSARPAAECSCDLPHTLRCAGDVTALQIIGRHLREQKARNKNAGVSLLDCALRGVTSLSAASVSELAGVGLHGLVISSGDIRRVQQGAFSTIASTLLALGLPNNQLPSVPTEAFNRLGNLDRLDLSNNKIHLLEPNAFKGIHNLTYLDLSDNQLTTISSDAFKPLRKLSVLRLRGNLLQVPALSALKQAQMLRDLDISSNALAGRLGPTTVPALEHLEILQLSDNTFASIQRGALSGLPNLTQLNLHNNQVDVLEDYAFRHLVNLTHLDLSHNEIVAVSGASLENLSNLVHLDLSHNFLRSLSAEPLKSLQGLRELMVHDNDITIIDDEALSKHKNLVRFTIEDNPLNCDCLLAGFARWLREATYLASSDKAAAVCATPPHLEGALLSRLSKSKLCDDFELDNPVNTGGIKVAKSVNSIKIKDADGGNSEIETNTNTDDEMKLYDALTNPKLDDERFFEKTDDIDLYVEKRSDELNDDLYDEELEVPSEDDLPVSSAKVKLVDAWYDEEEIHLSWTLDPPSTRRHRCTGVTAARAGGLPKHVSCHRAAPANVVLRGIKVDPAELYTFCIALEEMDATDTPVTLVLGCGNPLMVRQRASFATAAPVAVTIAAKPIAREPYRVSEVRSNVTRSGLLTVMISVMAPITNPFTSMSLHLSSEPRFYNCYVVIAVLSRGALVAQKDTPCRTTLEISMEGFVRGPYEVCATITKMKNEETRPICVVPQYIDDIGSLEMKAGVKGLNTAMVGLAVGLTVMILGLIWFVKKMLKKSADFEPHRRCFAQEPATPDESHRANYVMLTTATATSKV
ncbi:hypothetical protein O0L34_g3334 [Tuta absoluta]|nr:hypothetical protein O0L34_g3334 [Tuta absoluta]